MIINKSIQSDVFALFFYCIMNYNFNFKVKSNKFTKLSSLKNLDLGSNKIASLADSSFQGITSLKFLDLSNNFVCFYCIFHQINEFIRILLAIIEISINF